MTLVPLILALIFVFVTGACVGSFVNVAVARLPLEKSLIWPGSTCGSCLQPIRWYDNLPLLSYLWLRGRCRMCGQRFSIGYFLAELTTALGFVGLFWLEVKMNVHGWPPPRFGIDLIVAPWMTWLGFWWHALLFSFLMTATVCDLRTREIPLPLTLTGTFVGLIGATLMPWPWPQTVGVVLPATINEGIYAWPFWLQFPALTLPNWCGAGNNWQTGLTTGLVGALVGTFMLRGIAFIFSKGLGKEGLGLGDADLMMMAGAFLGWQIVVVAFFLSVFPALLFGIMNLVIRKDNSLPFGPSLSFSVMATCLAWEPIGAYVRLAFFWGELLFWAVLLCGGALYLMAFAMRLLRGQAAG